MWCNWAAMGLGGWTMMAGIWVLVALLIVWAVRSAPKPQSQGRGSNALQILDDRFASGAIGSVDYKERRAVLETRR